MVELKKYLMNLYFMKLTQEEFLYYCVAILANVAFGSGFMRFFASSLSESPPEESKIYDFNPFTNLDIIGTIVFLTAGFGWGRQVSDHKLSIKKQKLGWLILALIPPFASLTLALTAAYIKYFLWSDRVIDILLGLSVTITAYHILPIPPFAGSRIIYLALPGERAWRLFSKAGPFIILALVLLDRFSGTPFLRELMDPIVNAVGNFVAYR